jgi:hypothetical protein
MDVCVCVYSVCVVLSAALRRADHSSKESYRLFKKDYGTEEKARAKRRAVEPLMNEYSQVAETTHFNSEKGSSILFHRNVGIRQQD